MIDCLNTDQTSFAKTLTLYIFDFLNRNAYQFINLGHYFSFEYNRLWTVAEMNLQTEEIEFENQLVDISPVGIHLKKIEPGI